MLCLSATVTLETVHILLWLTAADILCRPQKQHPSRFQKLGLRIKQSWLKLTGQKESEKETAHLRDELAEPLLHDEEERGQDQLEDIQEVDLEAGQGPSGEASSQHSPDEGPSADRCDPST